MNTKCATCVCGTPSEKCGECPIWLADEEMTAREIKIYQKGRVDAIDKFVDRLNNIFAYRHDMQEINQIAEELKGEYNERHF